MFQVKHQDKLQPIINQKLVNIDIEDNYYVWLFPRTGSSLFYKLFRQTDFKCYSFSEDEKKLFKADLVHHHIFSMFPEINNFKSILTVRNPYSLLAAFFYAFVDMKDLSDAKKEFQIFLEKIIYQHENIKEILYNLNYVKIDYPLRIENLIEDYYNLPIIKKSIYFKQNKLEEIINSKVNKSSSKWANVPFGTFYNQNTADMVYYLFLNYFKSFNYEKNSWK